MRVGRRDALRLEARVWTDPELGAGRPTHVLWRLCGWRGSYSRAAGLHLVQEEWGGCSLLLGVYSASKKYAEKIGPHKRKMKHLNGSKDGTAKAEESPKR